MMFQKPLLTLFIAVLGIHFNCKADCAGYGISIFPKGKIISKNPVLIIQGYAESQFLIRSLKEKKRIQLVSSTDTVPLKVLKINVGDFLVTQAILKPTRALITGQVYALTIAGIPSYEENDFRELDAAWTVSGLRDVEKPIWRKTPTMVSKQMQFFGCGPSSMVNFCTCYFDESEIVVRAKVRNIKSNKVTEYFIVPDSSFFRLGFGMCSGPFYFDKNQEYSAQFTLMDASGNFSNVSPTVYFLSPNERDEKSEEETKLACDCNYYPDGHEYNGSYNWIFVIVSVMSFIAIVFVGYRIKKNYL